MLLYFLFYLLGQNATTATDTTNSVSDPNDLPMQPRAITIPEYGASGGISNPTRMKDASTCLPAGIVENHTKSNGVPFNGLIDSQV